MIRFPARSSLAVLTFLAIGALAGGCAQPLSNAGRMGTNGILPVHIASISVSGSGGHGIAIQPAFVGEGSLEVKSEKGTKTRLALEKLAVVATTTGDVAETSVTHVFRNDSNETLEGTFRFPLPEGAILTGLAMEIDGKLMEGELVERDKARKAYEQVVDQMLDPALLEWENGQTFKLRVFPIEPQKEKKVVIRFIAPLHRSADGLFFAFRPPASTATLTAERMSVVVDGKSALSEGSKKAASGEVLVQIADARGASAADVVSEKTKDGDYWLAHVRPSFAADAAAPTTKGSQALIVLCDRSRSMLEARGLQAKTLGMLIDKLGANDRFSVITGDVQTHSFAGGLHGSADKIAAIAFVDGTEPDGASDVGKLVASAGDAIKDARAHGLEPSVVYLGDASATWGETRAAELERMAKDSLSGATMHVVMLGKSTDETIARALAAGAHGRLLRPKTESDAEHAANEIIVARAQRRIEDVHLVGADGLDVPTSIPSTLYEGDEIAISLRAAKDKDAVAAATPTGVKLVGIQNGKELSQAIAIDMAKPAGHVAQRWAKAKIDLYERDGDEHKGEIVKTSLDHGVMSRYTSFLVLDSEEAYARFQIARKAKEASAAANAANGEVAVSGRDLDGDSHGASVSPDHLQPGDPEVRIPAPADAQSVVVVFPFGETKTAQFEHDEHGGGVWVARFLVDRTTPDGSYEILIRITHHDGRVEILKLPYVVDTLHPNFDVSIVSKKNGTSFEIHAKQKLTDAEIEAQSPSHIGTIDQRRERYAQILTDAKRVEVRAPDGQILSLTPVRLGEFVGTWTPNGSYVPGTKLRLIAVDRAMNENVTEVDVPR